MSNATFVAGTETGRSPTGPLDVDMLLSVIAFVLVTSFSTVDYTRRVRICKNIFPRVPVIGVLLFHIAWAGFMGYMIFAYWFFLRSARLAYYDGQHWTDHVHHLYFWPVVLTGGSLALNWVHAKFLFSLQIYVLAGITSLLAAAGHLAAFSFAVQIRKNHPPTDAVYLIVASMIAAVFWFFTGLIELVRMGEDPVRFEGEKQGLLSLADDDEF